MKELKVMSPMLKSSRIILLALAALCLSSCGYRFSGEGEGPRPGLRTVAIPVFDNKTTEVDAGALFAGALRREFMQKGNLKVVDASDAEAVFKGTITSIYVHPVAHRVSDIVSRRIAVENRLYITLDIRCELKDTGKVIWRDPNFRYYRVYRLKDPSVGAEAMVAYENRRDALEFIAREMAIRIHDRFLSNF